MTARKITGYAVSDYHKNAWIVNAVFSGNTSVELVKQWAFDSSHITVFFSDAVKRIDLGMSLPKAYCPKSV